MADASKPPVEEKKSSCKVTACAKKLCKPFYFIPALLALVALIAYFLLATGLDKKFVEAQLEQINQHLHENALGACASSELAYDDVVMGGGMFSRQATIVSPRVTCIDPAEQFELSTESLRITQEARDLSQFLITIPGQVLFSNYNTAYTTLDYESPVLLLVKRSTVMERSALDFVLDIPRKVKVHTEIIPLETEDGETAVDISEEVGDVLEVTFATPAHLETDTGSDGSRTVTASLAGMQMKKLNAGVEGAEGETVFSIASLAVNAKTTPGEVPTSQFAFTLDSLQAVDEETGTLPLISLALDMATVNMQGSNNTAEVVAKPGKVQLNKFDLKAGDLSVSASGEFAKDANEVLPEGRIHIAISDVAQFIALSSHDKELTDSDRLFLAAVMEKISGAPMADVKALEFDISRGGDGAVMVGKATFDELLRMVLTHAIQKENSKPQATPAPEMSVPEEERPEEAPESGEE